MNSDAIISRFVTEFRRDRDDLVQIQLWVDGKIERLLKDSPEIKYSLKSRVKEPESLEAKLKDRVRKNGIRYTSPAAIREDIKDLVAVRIILPFYNSQLETIKQLVRTKFECAGETPHGGPGYTAHHFQVLEHYPGVYRENLLIEIQVMSAEMYGIMEKEHDLVYKNPQANAQVKGAFAEIWQNAKRNDEIFASIDNSSQSSMAGIGVGGQTAPPEPRPGSTSFDNDDLPPEQVRMDLECSECRNRMPETRFHYFCTLQGDPHALQSPKKPDSPIRLQTQLGQDGPVFRQTLPLRSFTADNILPEIRKILRISPSYEIVLTWRVWDYQLGDQPFVELELRDMSAVKGFYASIGLYGRVQIRAFVKETKIASSFLKSFKAALEISPKSVPALPQPPPPPRLPPRPGQGSAPTIYKGGCENYLRCTNCSSEYPRCLDHGAVMSLRRIDPYIELALSAYDSPLLRSIKEENELELNNCLQRGDNLDIPGGDGLTAIQLVARSGWYRGAKMLLEGRASREGRDCHDFTPLMTSVQWGQRDILKLLLAHKADINAETRPGRCTALHYAAFADDAEMVKILLQNGANTDGRSDKGSVLAIAVTKNNIAVVEVLLKANVNPNEGGYRIAPVASGKKKITGSILHFAASVDAQQLIELLSTAKGLDPNIRDSFGITPLLRAARGGHAKACRALVKAKADVNCKDATGMTPLIAAIISGKRDIIIHLIDSGADVNHLRTELYSRNLQAQTPLSVAAMYGHAGTVDYLIERGAIPRMANYPGDSLRWADLNFVKGSASRDRHDGIRRYMQEKKDYAKRYA